MSSLPAASEPGAGSRRPRLRGWLHGAATPVALVTAVLLARRAIDGAPRISVIVFGVALVGLYGVSATYHVPRWSQRVRTILGRVDVAMIQLFIAASFVPVAVHVLEDPWRTWSLVGAGVIAVGGAAVAASPLTGPRWLGVAGYVTFGALLLVPVLRALDQLPPAATGLIVLSGVTYAVGGVVYAVRRPNPWPRWFAFHEVFHALVVIGSAVHVVAVWRYVLPLA
jgi:hemolysin III